MYAIQESAQKSVLFRRLLKRMIGLNLATFSEYTSSLTIYLWSFVCSSEIIYWTQSNAVHWIMFDWDRLPYLIELSLMGWVRLSSIVSKIELTQSSVFDFVRLPSSIEFNHRIEFDWVRFPKVRSTMPGKRERWIEITRLGWCQIIQTPQTGKKTTETR